jgi:hypothetical protein
VGGGGGGEGGGEATKGGRCGEVVQLEVAKGQTQGCQVTYMLCWVRTCSSKPFSFTSWNSCLVKHVSINKCSISCGLSTPALRPQTHKHQAPGTKHQAPSTKHQAPSTKHQAPSTKHQAPSTKHQAPSTKHQAQGVGRTVDHHSR